MEEAKVEAQNAIDLMYDAEREAELARLEAASAKATLDAIKKTREVEDYAKEERKRARKEARKARKEARKEARIARAPHTDGKTLRIQDHCGMTRRRVRSIGSPPLLPVGSLRRSSDPRSTSTTLGRR